eukprot:313664-Chlamydomonas_euryale.AAC.4
MDRRMDRRADEPTPTLYWTDEWTVRHWRRAPQAHLSLEAPLLILVRLDLRLQPPALNVVGISVKIVLRLLAKPKAHAVLHADSHRLNDPWETPAPCVLRLERFAVGSCFALRLLEQRGGCCRDGSDKNGGCCRDGSEKNGGCCRDGSEKNEGMGRTKKRGLLQGWVGKKRGLWQEQVVRNAGTGYKEWGLLQGRVQKERYPRRLPVPCAVLRMSPC